VQEGVGGRKAVKNCCKILRFATKLGSELNDRTNFMLVWIN